MLKKLSREVNSHPSPYCHHTGKQKTVKQSKSISHRSLKKLLYYQLLCLNRAKKPLLSSLMAHLKLSDWLDFSFLSTTQRSAQKRKKKKKKKVDQSFLPNLLLLTPSSRSASSSLITWFQILLHTHTHALTWPKCGHYSSPAGDTPRHHRGVNQRVSLFAEREMFCSSMRRSRGSETIKPAFNRFSRLMSVQAHSVLPSSIRTI